MLELLIVGVIGFLIGHYGFMNIVNIITDKVKEFMGRI